MSERFSDDPVLIPLVCENCLHDKAAPGKAAPPRCAKCGGTKFIRALTMLPDNHPVFAGIRPISSRKPNGEWGPA